MITDDFWNSWPAFWFMAGPFVVIASNLAYSLYLHHCYQDALLEALKNSRYVYIWGSSLHNRGWMGSILVIAKITGMIMMPKASLQLGELDAEDLRSFPPHLRRLLRINAVMICIGCVWLVVVGGMAKLGIIT